jgi:hypothetical protein
MADGQQQVDERALAASLFNATWTLLDKPDRTADEDDRMVHLAHASRHHWEAVGTDENRAGGEWQCSRVYAVLGRTEPALHHARRSIDYADRPGVAAWTRASAQEALARALLLAGDTAGAVEARDRALELLELEEDEEDRAIVAADLATLALPPRT